MRWPDDAEGWPHISASRIVASAPHRWHVQEIGEGPVLLLLHGAGASTHSWRDLAPLLARSYRVVMIDLPGQGFTRSGARHRRGLDKTAQDIARLIDGEGWKIHALIGHSAGAAVALRLAEDPPCFGVPVIGLNAALARFQGVAGWLFPMMAKALALAPFTAEIFVHTSSSAANVRRLIDGTGSRLTEEGLEFYRRLASDRDHVDGTLAMMARWSVDDLMERLPRHPSRVLLFAGGQDKAVPPAVSTRAVNLLPHGDLHLLPELGHLAHEEDPETCATEILAYLRQRSFGQH